MQVVHDSNSVMLLAPEATIKDTTYAFTAVNVKLNVPSLLNTGAQRLAAFMELYDEFKFTSLSFRWVPSLPSTTTGQVAMYYDPDPNAETPKTFTEVSGNKYLRVGHIATHRSLRVPKSVLSTARFNWFTRRLNDAQGTQGAVVVAMSPGTVPHANGKAVLGSLWMDYTIAVRAPTANVTATRASVPPLESMQYQLHQDLIDLSAHAEKSASIVKRSDSQGYYATVWDAWNRNSKSLQPIKEEPLEAPPEDRAAAELAALRQEVREFGHYVQALRQELARVVAEEQAAEVNALATGLSRMEYESGSDLEAVE